MEVFCLQEWERQRRWQQEEHERTLREIERRRLDMEHEHSRMMQRAQAAPNAPTEGVVQSAIYLPAPLHRGYARLGLGRPVGLAR